jgi:tellurite resistance protein
MQSSTERNRARSAYLLSSVVPATFFGMVLGLRGLGNGWRATARLWGVPAPVGEALSLAAAPVVPSPLLLP